MKENKKNTNQNKLFFWICQEKKYFCSKAWRKVVQ